MELDGNEQEQWKTAKHLKLEGSFSSVVLVRSFAGQVELRGNVGRWCRADNVFNMDFEQTMRRANQIVDCFGLPAFSDDGDYWTDKDGKVRSNGAAPPGYVLSGSTCALADARQAVDDKRQDFYRGINNDLQAFSGDQQGTISGIQGTTNSANDTLSFIGSNTGKPSSLSMVAKPGGGYVLTQSTQQQDAAGITYISNSSITFDSAGGVVSSSGAAVSGSLDTNTASVTGGATVVPAAAGSIQASPSSSEPIVFPTDYARQGEIAAAVAPVTSALTSFSAVSDPVEPLLADMPGWGDTFSGLTGWGLPAHVSACPTPSMDLSPVFGAGSVYTMTSHCDLFAAHAATFQAVMIVVWSILALFLVLGA